MQKERLEKNEKYMKMALDLAKLGKTSPNPKVGAVIVKGGVVVGKGYHKKAGYAHAEVEALESAGEFARGADMYVTLEPCCHFGRTPPCTDALIDAGIARVFVAMLDPDPRVSGKGVEILKSAGIEVVCHILEDEAKSLNESYIRHRQTGLPLVILKSAMSLDGKIATHTGDSKWITGEKARKYAHSIRQNVDAIVIGAETVRKDNPMLTARVGKKKCYPSRVVVTKSLDIPLDSNIFTESGDVYVACPYNENDAKVEKLKEAGIRIIQLNLKNDSLSMKDLVVKLAELGMLSILIEGGGELAGRALDDKIVTRVMLYYAPKIIGGKNAVMGIAGFGVDKVANAPYIKEIKFKKLGDDILAEGYVEYPENEV
ncbi:MAG: bifunctional diaminohydroxyphosphoribosylaminopyrimidine deaminase/5-amino-6-(5-phosphoribosylamino)uracil reductase RibD [Armatimonadota bacterium]